MSSSPNEKPDHRELVEVFDTEQETEAMVIKGLLDSAGIESLITGLDNPQDVLPVGGVIVRVAAEDAEEARRVIDEYRNHPGTEVILDDSDEE